MATDEYQRLAYHLDQLPAGFPSTDSGVEYRLLKRLFTPEEAELALHLTQIPESPRVIAYRAKLPRSSVEKQLEQLARKGCIISVTAKGLLNDTMPVIPNWIKRPILVGDVTDDHMLYMAYQFVIGIWEFHLNDLDPDFIRDMNEYMPYLIDNWTQSPQLRTVPIGKSLSAELRVMHYEKAEELIAEQDRLAVAECICRKEKRLMGEGCKKPLETCLVFGLGADYYIRNGIGRKIDKKEALKILKKAENAGLVLQPSNAREITNICCCCGCCCGVLRNLKTLPEPARHVPSAFVNTVDSETCDGCGACVKRCPMEALSLDGNRAVLDTTRCIGCGVCIPVCKTGSLKLSRKPESKQPDIPADTLQSSFRLSRSRGKMGTVDLTRMILGSLVDRFMAPR